MGFLEERKKAQKKDRLCYLVNTIHVTYYLSKENNDNVPLLFSKEMKTTVFLGRSRIAEELP